jgi:hypothetical protein
MDAGRRMKKPWKYGVPIELKDPQVGSIVADGDVSGDRTAADQPLDPSQGAGCGLQNSRDHKLQ